MEIVFRAERLFSEITEIQAGGAADKSCISKNVKAFSIADTHFPVLSLLLDCCFGRVDS